MKKEEYALLLLDNMPLNGYFVVAKKIGYLNSDDLEERLDYAIYEDIITGSKIYPSSYEANEFINPDEYQRQLPELKWISRKVVNQKKALDTVKSISNDDIMPYMININTSKEKKKNIYKEELDRHKKVLKKINHKR